MHTPVLLQEVLNGLAIAPDDIVVDGTLGNAGHASAIAKQLSSNGTLIGIDADSDALEVAKNNLADIQATLHLQEGNFRNMDTIASSLGYTQVTKILLDLGLRSGQIEESGRGFSFLRDEPLEMTFSSSSEGKVTAGDILNSWGEDTLMEILKGYGEERYAKRIAERIVKRREDKPFETTEELVETIKAAVPQRYRNGRIHPATRTFQALRIAVNDEIEALREGMEKGWDLLAPHGRFAVISFHSLEDRIVKHFFKKRDDAKVLTKKPLMASKEEQQSNPRARSAKLRIAEKKS